MNDPRECHIEESKPVTEEQILHNETSKAVQQKGESRMVVSSGWREGQMRSCCSMVITCQSFKDMLEDLLHKKIHCHTPESLFILLVVHSMKQYI